MHEERVRGFAKSPLAAVPPGIIQPLAVRNILHLDVALWTEPLLPDYPDRLAGAALTEQGLASNALPRGRLEVTPNQLLAPGASSPYQLVARIAQQI